MEISIVSLFYHQIVFLFLCYFTGALFLACNGFEINGRHTMVFLKLLSGLFILSTIYSCSKTSFETIQTGFIVAFLFYIFSNGMKKIRAENLKKILRFSILKSEFKLLLQLLFVGAFILIWNYSYVYGSGRGVPENPHYDLNFFSNIASFFNLTGIESFKMNYFDLQSTGTMPYHYFEIWITALASDLFHIPSTLLVIQLITMPIFLLVFISGFWAVIETFKIDFALKALSVSVIFISGVFLPVYQHLKLFWTLPFQSGMMDQALCLKTVVIALGLLFLFLMLLHKKYSAAVIVFMSFAFASVYAYVTFIPAGIVIALFLFYSKKIDKKQMLLLISGGLLLLLYYKFFYDFTKNSLNPEAAIDIKLVLKQLPEVSLKTRIIVVAEKLIETLLIYLPFVLCFILLLYKRNKIRMYVSETIYTSLIAFAITYASSILAWQFFYKLFGATEFYYTLASAIIIILSCMILCFLYMISDRLIYKSLLIVCTFAFCLYQLQEMKKSNQEFMQLFSTKYSASYLKKIAALDVSLKRGASLRTNEEILQCNDLSDPYYYTAAPYLNYFSPGYQLVSINIFDIPGGIPKVQSIARTSFVGSSPFYKMINEQIRNKSFVSLEKSKLDFINMYAITYLVVSKNSTIDSLIQTRIKTQFTDSLSGETFCLLHQK